MEDPEQLRSVVEKIVGSYESKVKVVTSLMREVNQRIRSFHAEQEQMTDRLKHSLAKNEYLRMINNAQGDIKRKGKINHQDLS